MVFTRAGWRVLVSVAGRAVDRGVDRAEDFAEDFVGVRLFVLAAAGVARGVAFFPKLFLAGLGAWAFAVSGTSATGFFTTEADRLGRAVAVAEATGVASVL